MAIKHVVTIGLGLNGGAIGWVTTLGFGALDEATTYTVLGPLTDPGERMEFSDPSARMTFSDPDEDA